MVCGLSHGSKAFLDLDVCLFRWQERFRNGSGKHAFGWTKPSQTQSAVNWLAILRDNNNNNSTASHTQLKYPTILFHHPPHSLVPIIIPIMPRPPYPSNRPHHLAHPSTTLTVPTWIHLPVPPTPPRTVAPFGTACVTPTGSPACGMPLSYSAANTPASTPTIPATPLTDPATATRRSQNVLGRSGTICLPPDLPTSLQDTIPDSVRVPQVRMDFAHMAQARMQGAAVCGEVSPSGHGVASFPNRVLYSHAGPVGTAEDLSSQTTKSSDHVKG